MKLSQLAHLLGVTPPPRDVEFNGISTDTRNTTPGSLFIALKGKNFDAHAFLAQAEAKNAAAILMEQSRRCTIPFLKVKSTVQAMGTLAAYHRSQFNLPVIGLTGSCGKTTTRALVASILAQVGPTLSSEHSFNNDIGVPLTLLRLTQKDQFAVVEMGANHFGEIAYLTEIAKPTVALITNAASAHLEGFGDVDGVCRAKGEIFQGLSANGTAVLNTDDPHCLDWEGMLLPTQKLLHFSLSNPTDIYAKEIQLNADGTSHFVLVTPLGETPIRLPILGQHNVANALAAAACAYAVGASLSAIQNGLEQVAAVSKRLNTHEVSKGIYVIDDTYNANPLSVRAAIDTLAQHTGEKILVLGDMGELGTHTEYAHRDVGKHARLAGINRLYTYGNASVLATESFGEKAQHFDNHIALITSLKSSLSTPTTILVKGSRSMRMERIVDGLMPSKRSY